jgi:hypothetical protein
MKMTSFWCGLIGILMAAVPAFAAEVRLADHGKANCVIVTPAGWMNAAELPVGLPPQAAALLQSRRELYRESVKDLALYLGKISGTTIEIAEGLPAGDTRVPIYIGAEAQRVFGAVGISKAGLFGFRVVSDRRGIGLYGESEVGTSYAIYELLHRLGCRWYMPTELGEVVPRMATLTVPHMDEKLAPATESRGMWQGGADFLRRNRMGQYGNTVWLAMGDGSLERFFTPQDLEAHPEWRALQADGKPHPWALRATHPGVAEHVAKQILAQLDEAYAPMRAAGLRPGYSITPGDGQVPTEDPMERPFDPDPRVWEPAAGRWSVTDRCMVLHGRIAERVRAKYPDVALGDYIYVNKTLPPARQPVPEDFRVMLAPIDFNRHHPMTWPDHPNEHWLRDIVQGWNRTGARLAFRGYGINLAELSAPCPFITKWGTDIAILLQNNLQDWVPETMNGWDSMLPGYVLASRMTFYPNETPQQILDDLWTKFYGAAAEPMARYWTGIDKAYLEARQYAGSPFGYLKIFTPEVMKAARADIDEALAKCQTVDEYRRVLLIDESFGLFEWYMKMRNDWAQGKVADLEADYAVWRNGIRAMQRKYGVIDRFAREGYAGDGHVQGRHGNPNWNDQFVSLGYIDGARMEREFARHGTPMLEWKWQHNPGPEADALPWTATDFDDSQWPTTHVVRDTWSSLGHHLTLTDGASGRSGRMTYRATQKLEAVPSGKKAYLWIGSTDGSVKVFVNGKHVKYITPDSGESRDAFMGYCAATGIGFDVTEALVAGDNQFTILAERMHLNELGTGGLMGPVVLYREKQP